MGARDEETKRDRLIQLISERLGIPPDEVVERSPFIEDLDLVIDMLDLEELALEIEDEFGDG